VLKQCHIGTIPENAGLGAKRRLDGLRGIKDNPDFRKKLDSTKYQNKVGAQDTLIAWALTDEDHVPNGVETRQLMERRLQEDLGKVERVAQKRLKKYPKRVIYVANSHASIITLAASSKLDVPTEELVEVPNAEGVRFDFYGPDTNYTTKPFGANLTAKIESLKQQ